MQDDHQQRTYSIIRLKVLLGLLVVVFLIVIIRLFYLQIIQYNYFIDQADALQIKSSEIEAERGEIYAMNKGQIVPLVINEDRWTMFSDTKFIDQDRSGQRQVQALIKALEGFKVNLSSQQKQQLSSDSRYVVLERQVTSQRRQYIIDNLKLGGVYFQKQAIRQYIEGDLASHVLGFLNRDSQGQYGVEQYYHKQLTGTPGQLHITTDIHDTPLLFIEDNIRIAPEAGDDILLTLNIPMQRIVEEQLQAGIENIEATGGSAVLMDADSGAVLAMANWPNFDPAKFSEADISLYPNKAVENILEPASTIKVLTMAAALNEDVVDVDDTYFNPRIQVIDGKIISNLTYHETGVISVNEILTRSLNTGSIEMLKRLDKTGDDQSIELEDRQILHDYFVNKFGLTHKTGIDLPNEVTGSLNPPDYPFSASHLYATMTFGQSLSVTPIGLTATFASLFNGGTFYRPYVVAQIGDQTTKPEIIRKDILKPQTLEKLKELMTFMANRSLRDVQYSDLEVSAKTGSSQVIDTINGGYLEDVSNGLMAGYIKSETKTLVLVVVIEDPKTHIAGAFGARPVWKEIVKNLVSIGDIY